MSENFNKWSMGIDDAIKSGNPLKAGTTALTNYFPGTIEMMRNGELKAGLGLMLLSFVGIPAAVILSSTLAIMNRRKATNGNMKKSNTF